MCCCLECQIFTLLFWILTRRWRNTISVDEHVYNFNSTVSAMAYSPIDPSHRYVLTSNGKFYHSSNGGLSWSMSSSFTGPDAHYFYGSDILASSVELGKVIISGSGYSNPPVFITYNHGDSFENMSDGMPSTLVFDLASTESENYIFEQIDYMKLMENGLRQRN